MPIIEKIKETNTDNENNIDNNVDDNPDNNQNADTNDNQTTDPNQLNIEFDRYFLDWLKEVNSSFLISCYKNNAVCCIGRTVHRDNTTTREQLSLWISDFERPMGMYADKDTRGNDNVYIGTSKLLWKYINHGNKPSDNNTTDFDASYIPKWLDNISDIDCHDIVEDENNNVFFVSAQFGCVCQRSDTHSFKVYWQPPWISKVAAEDRCHLNGLCLRDGVPRYVTAIAQTDVRSGWRENRESSGLVYDIIDNSIVCDNLSMPHSPRWYNNQLWILESGTGYFGRITDNVFKKEVFIQGFLRGLSFIGKYALIGSSLDRHEKVFQDIQLGKNLKDKQISAKCGVFIVNLDTMDVVHNLIIDNPIKEIYDVVALKGITRPVLESINDRQLNRQYTIEY